MANVEHDDRVVADGEQRSIRVTPTVKKLANLDRELLRLSRHGASLRIRA